MCARARVCKWVTWKVSAHRAFSLHPHLRTVAQARPGRLPSPWEWAWHEGWGQSSRMTGSGGVSLTHLSLLGLLPKPQELQAHGKHQENDHRSACDCDKEPEPGAPQTVLHGLSLNFLFRVTIPAHFPCLKLRVSLLRDHLATVTLE